MREMTCIDWFSGIGGFRLGLQRAGIRCVGFCEKNPFAVKSYRAMYDTEGEWYAEDITNIPPDTIPAADIWTAGTPCQNVSIAGKREGLRGDRSGLFFALIRLLQAVSAEQKPEWLILENVKGLLSSHNGWDFLDYQTALAESGYDTEYEVFNTRDFGLPQNRERVYLVGHLRTCGRKQVFPLRNCFAKAAPLRQLLGGSQGNRIYSIEGYSCTLTGSSGGTAGKTGLYLLPVQSGTKSGYELAQHGDAISLSFLGSTSRRGRVGKQLSQTLTCNARIGVVLQQDTAFAVRRLTPKECFRLQGFPDSLFEKAAAVVSDSQLYQQAGNAVSVPIPEAIGNAMQAQIR